MKGLASILRFLVMPGGREEPTEVAVARDRPGTVPSAYGSSRFLSPRQARQAGFIGSPNRDGIVLGRAAEAVWSAKKSRHGWNPICFERRRGRVVLPLEGHLTCFAPTRSGKTTGVVEPVLLSYPGSVVVTDPKGEIFKATASYRRQVLGQEIHVIDPFGIGGSVSTGFDLASFVRPDHFQSDCETLAKIVAPAHEEDKSPFFRQSAQQFIEGMIAHLHIVTDLPPRQRNLRQLCRWMQVPPEEFERFREAMAASPSPVARAKARTLTRHPETLENVKNEINLALASLDHDAIEAAISGTCDFEQLKERPMTVYLCMPEDRLANDPVFLRLFLASALAGIKRNPRKPRHRPLIVCDEFQNLGQSPEIAQDISLLAGYGGNVLLFVQNLGKLEEVYSKNQVEDFLANSAAVLYFRSNDARTKEHVSSMIGETTVVQETTSRQAPGRDDFFGRIRRSREPQRRPLLDPAEVGRLPGDHMICFLPGHAPLPILRSLAHEDPLFLKRLPLSRLARWERRIRTFIKSLFRR